MNVKISSAVLLTALSLTGCATQSASPTASAGQIKQSIRVQLKEEVASASVLAYANELATLPGVLDVSAGYDLDRPEPSQDQAAAMTFLLTYRDENAYRSAQASPTFTRVIEQQLRPASRSLTLTATRLQDYLVSPEYTQETEAATLQRRAAARKAQMDQLQRTK